MTIKSNSSSTKKELLSILNRTKEINQLLANNARASYSILDRDDVEDLEDELNQLNIRTKELEKAI